LSVPNPTNCVGGSTNCIGGITLAEEPWFLPNFTIVDLLITIRAMRVKMIVQTSALLVLALLVWVITVSAQTVPTPESVLGHKPGDDFYLANYDESREYFRKLAVTSNRIKLISVGKTTRGLDWEIALISSPQNLERLDRYKDISRRLALGRGLTDDQAKALAHEGKAIVHLDGGLHSTEVAGAQHTIQLAYKLVATQGDPEIDAILDNVIVMLWPTLNPDGQNEVVAWYRKNLGTPYEVSPLPDLYQEYVGHDNNRDGYMNNMLESQEVTRAELEWNPVVFYCHHQTAPFPTRIFIPPFTEPISSNIHPLMGRWLNAFGINMAACWMSIKCRVRSIVWDSITGIPDSSTSRISFVIALRSSRRRHSIGMRHRISTPSMSFRRTARR